MRHILVIFAMLAISATTMFAQGSDSESVQCTTQVIKALTINKNQDLDFGTVPQGVTETIPVTSANAVKLTVDGQANFDVAVTYSAPSVLTTSGGDELSFSAVIKANSTDQPSNASALSSGDAVTLNSSGNYYIYLGGSVTAASNQVPGFYTGNVTFDVEYN